MDSLNKKRTWTKKSKVLETIGNLKRYKFERIDTWNKTSIRKEVLYQYKCEWYTIDEVDSKFWREPLNLDWKAYSFDRLWKEFLVFT